MSADLKKFLENSKDYPDATVVKIGETEVPLGSLRALNSQERDQLAAAIKANADEKAQLDQRNQDAMTLSTKAQQAYDTLQATLKKATDGNANNGADPFADPWLVPVKNALDARDKTITELSGQVKQLATIIQNAAHIFSEDRWDREFAGIDFGKRDKKPSREEILKYATDNKLYDRHGMPSVRAAWDKMSEADRLEELRKTEFEKGREAGRMDALAARVPPPGVPGAGGPAAAPIKANPGELGDLYGEAIKDPELRAMLEQLPSGLA